VVRKRRRIQMREATISGGTRLPLRVRLVMRTAPREKVRREMTS
jgi:hypothetical protein